MKKSMYRVVPVMHERLGECWAVKNKEQVVKTFLTKSNAEKFKMTLEQTAFENFVLTKTANQELKLTDSF